jgi:hypothetical protein
VHKLVILLAGLVLVPSAMGARGGAPQTLSMSGSSARVLYGHSVTLTGRLKGRLIAGKKVTLDARPYGASAPHIAATASTNVNGAYVFKLRPKIQTAYQAHAGSPTSPKLTVGVSPVIAVTVLANGRVRVQVTAARPFDGRLIQLQKRKPDGNWTTVARKKLSPASIAVIQPKLPTSTIRVAMSVNQAGVGYLGAASHPLLYRERLLTMTPSSTRVLYGRTITLGGRLVNGTAGERIRILARPYGRSAPLHLATVVTGPGGRFSIRVTLRIQTTCQAQFGAGMTSTAPTVGVAPAITVKQLASGGLTAHVAAALTLRGRMVELQRRTGGAWQTVARRPLNAASTARFDSAPAHSTLRVAMSVNQAGAGYLGAFTHPFLYRAL